MDKIINLYQDLKTRINISIKSSKNINKKNHLANFSKLLTFEMKSEQDFDNKSQTGSENSDKQMKSSTSIKSGSETMTAEQMQAQQVYKFMNKYTEDDVNTIKRVFSQFRDFKIDKQNKIQITNASKGVISQIMSLWKKRPVKHPNYSVIISLTTPQFEKQSLIEESAIFASIKWIIDGEQIQNQKAIHKIQNSTYYEGIDGEHMMITKSNGEVIDYFEGQTKQFVQNGKGILAHIVQGKTVWTYSGEFVDGKRQGNGRQIGSKGVTYEGDFKNDFKEGKGMEIVIKKRKHPRPGQQPYVEKNRYIGEFQLGYKQGHGQEITPHGQYEGQWHEGMKHGKGVLKYKKGDIYEGQWQNNYQHGEGVYKQFVTVEGDEDKFNVYTGEFKQGFYHGKGVMQYYNGDKYDGEWALGKKEGSGMYEWSDGDYYDGQWQKDSAEGSGAACFGGVFYDGEFHLGEKHGLGEETDENGDTLKAMWQGGKIIKKLEINGEIVEEEEEEN